MAYELRDDTDTLVALPVEVRDDISKAMFEARKIYFATNPTVGDFMRLVNTVTGQEDWRIESI